MESEQVQPQPPLITDNQSSYGEKRLTQGCTHLMYACQQGLTDEIVGQIRSKVGYPVKYLFVIVRNSRVIIMINYWFRDKKS